MNSLVSYGSDDNSEDSGDEKFPEMPGRSNVPMSKNYRKPALHGDNYEEVGMDMSEDSNDSTGSERQQPKSSNQTSKPDRSINSAHQQHQQTSPTSSHKPPSLPRRRSGSRSPKHKKEEDEKKNNRNEDRSRDDRSKGDDRNRKRDERSSRESRDDDRTRRDDDRTRRDDDKARDRHRDDRRDRRDDRYGRDRRDRRRSRSRDKRRSRSPRRPSRSPRRSRSGSKDKGPRGFPSRREKADKRMDRLDKLGIEFKPDNYPASAIEEAEMNIKNNSSGNRFFMPGITGRFRDQIEKRKLLWHKAKEQDIAPVAIPTASTNVDLAAPSGSKATKVYEATSFADDKTSNKFKRLMGIREPADTSNLPVKTTDVLKKQQEMFSSMEAQYEVARTATHTMRGVGLGFGSFQK